MVKNKYKNNSSESRGFQGIIKKLGQLLCYCQEKSDMIEYKPTNKIFPNRKAAKQHFGKQYFNKLWQEDKFIIVNNSNVANFDELQKNTPISSR